MNPGTEDARLCNRAQGDGLWVTGGCEAQVSLWDASCLGVIFNDSSNDTVSPARAHPRGHLPRTRSLKASGQGSRKLLTPRTQIFDIFLRVCFLGFQMNCEMPFRHLQFGKSTGNGFIRCSSYLLTSAFPEANFPLSGEAMTYNNAGWKRRSRVLGPWG